MKPSNHLIDHDSSLEGDALWDSLDQNPQHQPSPNFVQNTVRAARLSKGEHKSWAALFTKPAFALSGVTAALVLGFSLFTNQEAPVADTGSEWYNAALLSAAGDAPELFSDTELVAMIF